jgi:RNA polymerase sigma-70 factor (ECF subfamily)
METINLTKNDIDPDIENEDSIVEAARNDPEAFASLYRRYLTPVYRYLLCRLNNVHDTEDLTAQVFTEALEGLTSSRYQSSGRFAAWLFTITRRRLVDFYRKRPNAPLSDPQSPDPSILSTIENIEVLQRLAHLLGQLDAERQELLRLRFSAGLSFAQISQLDGRSEAAVKMVLYRTVDFLREHWEEENG